MDTAQVFVLNVGWAFFAGWGMVLAAASIIAFGRDILSVTQQTVPEQENRR
jgi:hypothetical protein